VRACLELLLFGIALILHHTVLFRNSSVVDWSIKTVTLMMLCVVQMWTSVLKVALLRIVVPTAHVMAQIRQAASPVSANPASI